MPMPMEASVPSLDYVRQTPLDELRTTLPGRIAVLSLVRRVTERNDGDQAPVATARFGSSI